MRTTAAALLSLVVALLAAATASGAPVTLTATAVDGRAQVTWTQPPGYPDAFVDYVEVATSPALDEYGFFLLENVVDYDYFATADASTGTWLGDEILPPGTYSVHVEVYAEKATPQTAWSDVVSFTVSAPAEPPPPAAPPQPAEPPPAPAPPGPAPPDPGPPGVSPVPGESQIAPEEEPPRYQVRTRVGGNALVLALRDVTQGDDGIRRYRVCWTTSDAVSCATRRLIAGSWDELRVKLKRSVGRVKGGRRIVEVTWYVRGAKVATRRHVIRPRRAQASA